MAAFLLIKDENAMGAVHALPFVDKYFEATSTAYTMALTVDSGAKRYSYVGQVMDSMTSCPYFVHCNLSNARKPRNRWAVGTSCG